MTELDLDAIRARCDAATPGPWFAATSNRRKDGYGVVGRTEDRGTGKAIAVFAGDPDRRTADAKFTAAAREDVPALLREVERLRGQLAREEAAHGQTVDERDNAQEWADRLAYAIAPLEVIGEHSSGNNPWANAYEIAETSRGEVERLRAEIDQITAAHRVRGPSQRRDDEMTP